MRKIVTACCFICFEKCFGAIGLLEEKKFICSFGATVRCLAFAARRCMVSRALRLFSASASVFCVHRSDRFFLAVQMINS